MQLIYTIYLFYSKSERMLIQKRNPIFTIIHTTFILLVVGFQSQFCVLYFSQFKVPFRVFIYFVYCARAAIIRLAWEIFRFDFMYEDTFNKISNKNMFESSMNLD